MDADEEYLRKSQLIACICAEDRDMQTDALMHKYITDDEDYEILRHPTSIIIFS